MDNSNYDYSFHYANWHNESEESRRQDINNTQNLFNDHSIWHVNKDARILEIGCGMGRLLLTLREAGYTNLSGIDIDQSQIEIARKEQLDVHLSDAIAFLQQDNNSYDVIYAFDVLEHIAKEQQLTFLRLLHSHLTTEGFIVLQSPNALSPTEGYFRYIDFTHTISFTEESLGFLLHNADFHFFTIRPQHQESRKVQQLKLPWAKLYRHEFGLQHFILTPNLLGVAFKSKPAYQQYLSQAPEIANHYPEKAESLLSRLWRHIKSGKF